MSATSREISSVSEILPLFHFSFYLFNFRCFLLQNYFERVSAELGDYDSISCLGIKKTRCNSYLSFFSPYPCRCEQCKTEQRELETAARRSDTRC